LKEATVPFRVVLRSSQRAAVSSSKPVPTRAAALELGKHFLDEAIAREEAHGWWRTEVVSVCIEEIQD
jgi:hypothetical protein